MWSGGNDRESVLTRSQIEQNNIMYRSINMGQLWDHLISCSDIHAPPPAKEHLVS